MPTQSAPPSPAAISDALRQLAVRWADAKARERANYQLYLGELCTAIGVEGPRPAGSGYEYEFPVKVIDRDGKEATNYVDLFKRDHFVLEAKDKEPGRSDDLMLRKAYGQARSYITHLPGKTPPYVMVLDVGRTMVIWDRWEGTFGGFGAGRRIDLHFLHERPDDIALLRDIWEFPNVRDPRERAQVVTKAIAEKLARLATSLELRGFGQERVSRFLMRCVFTIFAEDVRLLHDEPFRRLVGDVAMKNPDEFPPGVEELWRAMNEGRRFGFRKVLRFNGHFFAEAEGLPLTRSDLAILLEAAEKDWSDVEPAIFGTLLTRALDAKERHRLGAEYTPPEFIARVIRPAVEEPIRERWTAVQAEVLQLLEAGGAKGRKATGKRKLAEQRLRDFHDWLRSLSFLDPACGSPRLGGRSTLWYRRAQAASGSAANSHGGERSDVTPTFGDLVLFTRAASRAAGQGRPSGVVRAPSGVEGASEAPAPGTLRSQATAGGPPWHQAGSEAGRAHVRRADATRARCPEGVTTRAFE